MSDMSPARCPVCGSIGTRRYMLDHIEAEHPGPLMRATVTDEMVEMAFDVIDEWGSIDAGASSRHGLVRKALEAALRNPNDKEHA